MSKKSCIDSFQILTIDLVKMCCKIVFFLDLKTLRQLYNAIDFEAIAQESGYPERVISYDEFCMGYQVIYTHWLCQYLHRHQITMSKQMTLVNKGQRKYSPMKLFPFSFFLFPYWAHFWNLAPGGFFFKKSSVKLFPYNFTHDF